MNTPTYVPDTIIGIIIARLSCETEKSSWGEAPTTQTDKPFCPELRGERLEEGRHSHPRSVGPESSAIQYTHIYPSIHPYTSIYIHIHPYTFIQIHLLNLHIYPISIYNGQFRPNFRRYLYISR